MTLLPSLLYPSFSCSVAGAGKRGTLSLYAEVVLNNQNHHHPYLPAPNQRTYLAPRDEASMPQTFLAAVVKRRLSVGDGRREEEGVGKPSLVLIDSVSGIPLSSVTAPRACHSI